MLEDEKYTVNTEDDPVFRKEDIVRINIIHGPQLTKAKIPTVIGAMPVSILAYRFTVPYRDALKKTGYQRIPQKSRVSKLAKDLDKSIVDIPTAVLLNVRGSQVRVLLEQASENFIDIDPEDDDFSLYVVDGQHRVLAIRSLCEDEFDRWADFRVPFVLMLGATEDQEMRQFYVVNSNAKSVKTDLAYDLLKQQTDRDGKVLDQTIKRQSDVAGIGPGFSRRTE